MFNNPYETTPCADYNMSRVKDGIRLSIIEGTFDSAIGSDKKDIPGVRLITSRNRDIPPFSHPFIYEEDGKKTAFIDARGFTRIDREGAMSISSKTEYDFNVLRAKLSLFWVAQSPADLLALGQLPMTVFCRWISENLARRFGLDPASQMRATIVAGFFYLSMYRIDPEMDEEAKIKSCTQISRATRINVDDVFEIADKLKPITNVKDFVENLVEHVGSVRLERFNIGVLYSSLGGSWFGGNAPELIAVALEHPPTFLAMVFTALHERGFRNTGIAKVVLAADRGDLGRTFSYHLLSLPQNVQ